MNQHHLTANLGNESQMGNREELMKLPLSLAVVGLVLPLLPEPTMDCSRSFSPWWINSSWSQRRDPEADCSKIRVFPGLFYLLVSSIFCPWCKSFIPKKPLRHYPFRSAVSPRAFKTITAGMGREPLLGSRTRLLCQQRHTGGQDFGNSWLAAVVRTRRFKRQVQFF